MQRYKILSDQCSGRGEKHFEWSHDHIQISIKLLKFKFTSNRKLFNQYSQTVQMAGIKLKANCFSYKRTFFEKIRKICRQNNAQKISKTREMVQNLRECKNFRFG